MLLQCFFAIKRFSVGANSIILLFRERDGPSRVGDSLHGFDIEAVTTSFLSLGNSTRPYHRAIAVESFVYLNVQRLLAFCLFAESKLESGAIYEIQLFGGRVCPQGQLRIGKP